MSTDEIRDYLSDNTDLPESQIADVAYDIQHKLDYSPMYEQIDEILRQFAYAADYDRTIRS